jgi:hypothetical protein
MQIKASTSMEIVFVDASDFFLLAIRNAQTPVEIELLAHGSCKYISISSFLAYR